MIERLATMKLSPAQERVLAYIAEGRPLTASDGRTVPVLQRRGLIEPRTPAGTGWQLTELGTQRTPAPPAHLCRYCGKPRPWGYTISCGRSECQEEASHDKEVR